ncbi:iron-containing redox enzyme family protein [Aliivibrio fischeri]|uniref:iron-containing redox enzyme family protein n=1 Tax=Aliivibrio fischeri TaxID=668 RepID=UPI00080ECCF2|nr:iron-containing redox enzyme family protein [Aliivibrio fischeri]OCH38077.1 cupin [Aliivibrio fischeri]
MSLNTFLSCELFTATPNNIFMTSPYQRPCRPQDLEHISLNKELCKHDYSSNHNLLVQRSLLNIYELDLIFLPTHKNKSLKDFYKFYNDENLKNGSAVLASLENNVFSFLNDEVKISGKWDKEDFDKYTKDKIQQIANSESDLYKKILNSKDPKAAAKFFLIQCSGDFLSEASAMARNVLGNFGPITSELFKVLIDEYGYGVHEKKHSSIFEKLMKDAGLNSDIHYYWNFYTPTSISLINYFHYISKNHNKFFKYLGALYFTEATLASATKHQSKVINEVFKGEVNSLYFDEHSHIDVHHGRMALENIIHPLIEELGEQIIPDILAGFEEFAVLQDIADEELYKHIEVHDNLNNLIKEAESIKDTSDSSVFIETKGEISVSHIHHNNELFMVNEGELELYFSPFKKVTLKSGERIIIPKGILHMSKVLSDKCQYSVKSLKD